MNGKQLCEALGITRSQLNAWTDRGLPLARDGRGRPRFDPPAVRQWLIAQGLAQETRTATTRDQVAKYFGVSVRTVAQWMASGCPGRPRQYDLHAIHAWRDTQGKPKPDQADPLLAGVASPALERYRDERAKIARLDRLAREKSLLPRDQVHALLGQIAQIIRGAGETLQRAHGPEAQATLDEALDEAQRLIDTLTDADDDPPP